MIKNIPKIFVSYTVRDGKIDREFLSNLEIRLKPIGRTYIDMIHNNSIDKQKRVMDELKTSDLFFLIKTEEVKESEWVKKEILVAKEKEIPIYEFEFMDLIENEFQPITQYKINY